jgi:hypothetical protein
LIQPGIGSITSLTAFASSMMFSRAAAISARNAATSSVGAAAASVSFQIDRTALSTARPLRRA